VIYKVDLIRAPGSVNKEDLNRNFVYVFHLSGNFVMEISDEFTVLMTTLVGGGMTKAAFDLADLKYIDSTGIGLFISVAKQVRAKGGDLVFLNVNPAILEIFNLVKMNDFIPFLRGEKQIADHFFVAKG